MNTPHATHAAGGGFDATQHTPHQVWRIQQNGERTLIAAFACRDDAIEYGDEYVAGERTRYEVVSI